jgi:hypothetical protein
MVALMVISTLVLSACGRIQSDLSGPSISDISTSGKVLVISDCPSTSVTITAKVTDKSKITHVLLWYRIGADRSFASINMDIQNDVYTAVMNGPDLQGHGYGAIEFYITAEDAQGNMSESPHVDRLEFLPCVNN